MPWCSHIHLILELLILSFIDPVTDLHCLLCIVDFLLLLEFNGLEFRTEDIIGTSPRVVIVVALSQILLWHFGCQICKPWTFVGYFWLLILLIKNISRQTIRMSHINNFTLIQVNWNQCITIITSCLIWQRQ